MLLIIFLSLVIVATLIALRVLDRLDQTRRRNRLHLRRLQNQTEELQDLLDTLNVTIPNTRILIAISDYLIEQLESMLAIDDAPTETITINLNLAQERKQLWQENLKPRPTRYVRESDAHIAQTQMQLSTTMKLLPTIANRVGISPLELDVLINELRWANLMVSVMSFVAQGDKFMAISDRFSAYSFYRKAQQLLMESLHSDPRRTKMIKEIGEIIDGDRRRLSDEFLYQEAIQDAETEIEETLSS